MRIFTQRVRGFTRSLADFSRNLLPGRLLRTTSQRSVRKQLNRTYATLDSTLDDGFTRAQAEALQDESW